MSNILVIGYGNTLRGDDAVGIRAAELIAQRHTDINCICMHQLMPELAEQIAVSDIVFFIDADVETNEPRVRSVETPASLDQPRSHFISPESLLSLSRQLYQRIPKKAYTIGIPASQFEFSEELSEKTQQAMVKSIELVETILQNPS